MTATTPGLNPVCRWCGMHHGARCPFVSAIEYEGDGVTVKRVEFFPPAVPKEGSPRGPWYEAWPW